MTQTKRHGRASHGGAGFGLVRRGSARFGMAGLAQAGKPKPPPDKVDDEPVSKPDIPRKPITPPKEPKK